MEHYLGYPDATIPEEQEAFLADNFVLTDSIARALRPEFPFVCGRKGAGKSAVAYRLHRDVNTYSCRIALTREDYDQLHLQLVTAILNDPNLALCSPDDLADYFFRLWTYVLDLCVFHACLSLRSHVGPSTPREFHPIQQYVSQHGGDAQSPPAQARSEARRLLHDCAGSASAAIDFGDGLARLSQAPGFEQASDSARALLADHRALITIDTLESYDLSDGKVHPFRGLCRAVRRFRDRNPYGNAVVKCFLPAEMTEHVFAENVAMYRTLSVFLEWRYAELIEFIARRYASFLSQQPLPALQREANQVNQAIHDLCNRRVRRNHAWRDQVWRCFAPSTVTNTLGWDEDSAAYLFRHTQKRPRESLYCMNHIIEQARDAQDLPRISSAALQDGIHFPDNLFLMLGDNLAVFRLPTTETVGFRTPDVIALHDLIRRVLLKQPRRFRARELRGLVKRAYSTLSKSGVREMEDAVRAILLRSGLVGEERGVRTWIGKDGKEHRYYLTAFEYTVPALIELNEKSMCAIHPMLGDCIQSYDHSAHPGVVYPLPEAEDLVEELGTSP